MTIHRARQASACPLLSRRTAEAAGGAAPGHAGLHNEAHLLPLRCRPPGPSGARACTPEHRGPAQAPRPRWQGRAPPKGRMVPRAWRPGRSHLPPAQQRGGPRGRPTGEPGEGMSGRVAQAATEGEEPELRTPGCRLPLAGPLPIRALTPGALPVTGSQRWDPQRGQGPTWWPPSGDFEAVTHTLLESLVGTDGPSLAQGCPGRRPVPAGVRQGIREGPQSRGRGL